MTSTRPLFDAPKVGGDILAYCTKCKMELAHVVVAMVERTPAKVLCKTCKTQHAYRRLGGTGATGGRRSVTGAKAVPRPRMSQSARWEERLSETKGRDTRPYDVKATLTKDDVIQHSQFGVGVVEEVKPNGKVLVLFRDGEKILVHARA